MPSKWFYQSSIRKWILQIIRQFSEYQYEYLDGNGNPAYMTIPVRWADQTFSAATIASMNSENTMLTFPMMSLYISGLHYDRSRIHTPTFVDTKNVRTRKYDFATNTWLQEQGNAYTVQRRMPAPWMMDIKLELVTTNTTQKLQIVEQIAAIFNPMLELQKNDDYMDWESLSYIELTDTEYSSRQIPIGTSGSDSSYDILTWTFKVPIWMSLPVKVSKMGVIFKVVTDIQSLNNDNYLNDIMFSTRKVVTYQNYGVYVTNGQIRLLQCGIQNPSDSNSNISLYGEPLDWSGVLDAYGSVTDGVTQVGLAYGNCQEILGSVTIDPSDSTILLYNVDNNTLPANTLAQINSIVNPTQEFPGYGLPNALEGQSYLITEDANSDNWPSNNSSGIPSKNDIITYSSSNVWGVTFNASDNVGNIQYVWDEGTSSQYRWDGNDWVSGWYGPYDAAHWRIIL